MSTKPSGKHLASLCAGIGEQDHHNLRGDGVEAHIPHPFDANLSGIIEAHR
jgi:hypothetical protein